MNESDGGDKRRRRRRKWRGEAETERGGMTL